MPTRELLPGVTTVSCPPSVVCDAHAEIRAARRRVMLREVLQVALLIAVDVLFIRWPDARMPFVDRAQSLALLRMMNVLIIADVWLTRALPRLTARRIAATWSRSEQAKFQRRLLS